eukprot:CAMPEP_0171059318 /NCGR_PEP_ID=MMETSP0766_2-20121228/3113_1 /TAXON_ID=439317 /ORGANISM="Gambierdiscus australes, Strain CAWD 149" /LENGTH=66 /DNA_ID=CAMNT_0011514745 /DNA_START=81 /DNA_END=278 /DNA_ORIENTATION=+
MGTPHPAHFRAWLAHPEFEKKGGRGRWPTVPSGPGESEKRSPLTDSRQLTSMSGTARRCCHHHHRA